MDHYSTIANSFQDTVEAVTLSVDELAPSISAASEQMTDCLLRDGTLFACGLGSDSALALLFAGNLLGRYARERPALPAIALGADGATLTAAARAGETVDVYARQLRALGQTGDVLLCINSGAGEPALSRAVIAARERNMAIIYLSNPSDAAVSETTADVQVIVDAPNAARVAEVQFMVVNCLCDLIDQGLFGSYSEE